MQTKKGIRFWSWQRLYRLPLLREAGFLAAISASLVSSALAIERPASPFVITPTLEARNSAFVVRFHFDMPSDHVIYADHLHFETENGTSLLPQTMDAPILAFDTVTGKERKMYSHPFSAQVELASSDLPLDLVVKLQGCSNSACYFPERHYFTVSSNGVALRADSSSAPVTSIDSGNSPTEWKSELEHFRVVGRQTGYMKTSDFLAFLDKAQSGTGLQSEPMSRFNDLGLTATAFFILIGGAGLNLTPCVLPLIPINLAIIGAGARARSRRRGFALGAVYGAGMALAYGGLGLVVVLTGAKFGTLNASIWFNICIALIFFALGLAMFDFINIDFTRFQHGSGSAGAGLHGQTMFAFFAGALAALLAGACVAPVVISVLLISTNLYLKGVIAGLLLPFLLGLGMALPWPFAGAGLTFLPKPGRWMKWVKRSFGILILLFAFYYGHVAWAIGSHASTSLASTQSHSGVAMPDAALTFAQALHEAHAKNRPVLIDFHASWCKNCLAMDETVFSKSNVQERLADYAFVKYQAESPNEPPAKEVLDRLGVMGLPTYIVLKPKQ